MIDFIENVVQPHFNYWAYVVIMMIGLWALIAKKNLIKKLIGMSIFQTAIILFYVSLGVKDGATIPILEPYAAKQEAHKQVKADGDYNNDDQHHKKKSKPKPKADEFANPLPHVLMLTAIVVGVATLGVALAVTQSIFKSFGTIEEPEILEKIKSGDFVHHD